MNIRKDIAEQLTAIGLSTDSRALGVLNTILQISINTSKPVTTNEVYEKILSNQHEVDISRAWIHKVIKNLYEMRLIRAVSEKAYRKQYTTNLETIISGLDNIKAQRLAEIEQSEREIIQQKTDVDDVDCQEIGEYLHELFTGLSQKMSSRFIRGLSEFHRVTNYSIYQVAKKGDIIRNCLLWVEPFLTSDMGQRLQRLLEAAKKGIEIRYFATQDIFSFDEDFPGQFDLRGISSFLKELRNLNEAGYKLEFRVYKGPKNTYQFAGLNRDRIAFFLTQDPITAVYFTREFNSDLIENSITHFDKYWEDAPDLFKWLMDNAKSGKTGKLADLLSSLFIGMEKK